MQILNRVTGMGNDKIVRCPRCLNEVSLDKKRAFHECNQALPNEHGELVIPCNYVFPPLYVESFGSAVPVPVQVFGWTSHGKTVYLNAMRLMLMNMGQVWTEYDYRAITDRDIEMSRLLRTEMENGIMPKPTQSQSLHENYIYIMQLNHMVRWGSRFLIMMDHAGERFDYLEEFEAHEIPFLTHKDTTTMMFLSVPLLRGELVGAAAAELKEAQREALRSGENPPKRKSEHFGRSMDELLTIYIQAMITHDKHEMQRNQPTSLFGRAREAIKNAVIQSRRKLVVVLTMADVFVNELPPNLRDYLLLDDTWDRVFDFQRTKSDNQELDVAYMEKYMARMEKVSQAIRDWIFNDLRDIGGAEFIKSIEGNNIEARYTLVSSLGHNEVSLPHQVRQHMGTKIAPKRILDPLFWILEYQKYRG